MTAADSFDNWTTQVRKGMLEYCVLTALAGRERYGYELVKAMVEVPGLGISEGTLYPILSRLRVQGMVSARLVESSEGPARKYHTLTPEGMALLGMMQKYWEALNHGTRVLEKKGLEPG